MIKDGRSHQDRAAKRIMDGRRRFDMFPRGNKVQGWWLYAVGLPDGRCKVGIAAHPRSRVQQHWRTHGGLVWAHVFGRRFDSSPSVRHAESLCLGKAAKIATRLGRTECFADADPRAFVVACREGIAAYERGEVDLNRWWRLIERANTPTTADKPVEAV